MTSFWGEKKSVCEHAQDYVILSEIISERDQNDEAAQDGVIISAGNDQCA